MSVGVPGLAAPFIAWVLFPAEQPPTRRAGTIAASRSALR
uniref:Uncharacterized protein n=1 Tax=Nonomuraea gerenzanensis TaxID=93944 RepID=A0A1M4EKH5_9ACTN|nr:hypothetical protein BN4615_P8830 [Nonomuraea gerenzanensis]